MKAAHDVQGYFKFNEFRRCLAMSILAIFDVDKKEIDILSKALEETGHELRFYQRQMDMNSVHDNEDIVGIAMFIRPQITSTLLDHLPRLKIISAMSTGYDHIDLQACKARNVTVCNVPDYADNTVAEYAFGLIVSLLRKFRPTFDRINRGIFSRTGLLGTDIKGKTLGLVGAGRIGSHMARLGCAYGMKVIAHDLHPKTDLLEGGNVEFKCIEIVLSEADVISLHVPYNASTHHMINEERLRLFKPSAFLINTSRGKVVDTKALADALREGRLAGAALDTFEGTEMEILVEEEMLRRDDLTAMTLRHAWDEYSIMHSERVILTPYNAFNTEEALERIVTTTAKNINAYFSGHPQNVVTGS
jgi:D-lactate dehydrogenase